jgi:hypothetical protein
MGAGREHTYCTMFTVLIIIRKSKLSTILCRYTWLIWNYEEKSKSKTTIPYPGGYSAIPFPLMAFSN